MTIAVQAAVSPPAGLPVGWLGGARCVVMRDLRLALRRRADTLAALVFFVMVVSLFPLGV
jgi:heme exporter protein B